MRRNCRPKRVIEDFAIRHRVSLVIARAEQADGGEFSCGSTRPGRIPERVHAGILVARVARIDAGPVAEDAGFRIVRERQTAGLVSLEIALARKQRKEKRLVLYDRTAEAGRILIA